MLSFRNKITIGLPTGEVYKPTILEEWESKVRALLATVPPEKVDEVVAIVNDALAEMQWQSR